MGRTNKNNVGLLVRRCVVVSMFATIPVQAQQFENGSFETPAVARYTTIRSSTQIPGWAVTRGDVSVNRSTWPASEGDQTLELNGTTSGRISQSVGGFTVGNTYFLNLDYALHSAAREASANITIDGRVAQVIHADVDDRVPNYTTSKVEFKATARRMDFGVVSLTQGSSGLVIDKIRISESLDAGGQAIADRQSGSHVAPLFEVFDNLDGRTPASSQGSSTLSMDDGSTGWSPGTQWYAPQLFTEDQVFHRELQHRASEGDWDIRIGKGGQLYSWNVEGVGEIIPPQSSPQSPWMDLVILATVRDSDNHDRSLTMNGEYYGDGYVHAAGMYIKPFADPLNDKPFYSPMFAEKFSADDRSYGTLTLGVVPKPSINRADILFYTQYKFLGDGVLEITYYVYNFGDGTFRDNAFPWSAVRHSVFPNTVRSTPRGGFENYDGVYPKRFKLEDQGGWLAKTTNSSNSRSLALSMVHGLDHHNGESWQSTSSFASSGYSSNVETTTRDFSLMTAVNRIAITPGTGFYWRTYMVMGELADVSSKSYDLVSNMDYGPVEFTEADTSLLPVYTTLIDGSPVLTTEKPDRSSTPLFSTYSMPVKNSVPLFLIKNIDTGIYHVTTDQYAVAGKRDFIDDNNVLRNRVIHQPYDLRTEWVSVLGYVMPSEDAEITANTVTLNSLKAGNFNFRGGDKYNSGQLIVRTDGNSN